MRDADIREQGCVCRRREEPGVRPANLDWNAALTGLRSEAAGELKSRGLDFLPFPKLEEAVKDDVQYLKSTKLVPDNITISGWVYEVETGKTVRVV